MKPAPFVVLLASLVLLAPLGAKDKAPADGKVFILEPFKVKGAAASNFAIDIRILVDAGTNKVYKILITRVVEDSDAAELGLQTGDEIVKIDGVPVEGMDPKVDISSQIGRIFLNRQPGDKLKLEVLTRRIQEVTLRAQLGN